MKGGREGVKEGGRRRGGEEKKKREGGGGRRKDCKHLALFQTIRQSDDRFVMINNSVCVPAQL